MVQDWDSHSLLIVIRRCLSWNVLPMSLPPHRVREVLLQLPLTGTSLLLPQTTWDEWCLISMFSRDSASSFFKLVTSWTAAMMSMDSACKLLVSDNRELKLLLVITRLPTKSVVVMANRRVDASVRASGDQPTDLSALIDSKHVTIAKCRALNRWRASIRSTHLVRHKSFNLCTDDEGLAVSIASSSFRCRLGCAWKKRETRFTTPIMFRTHCTSRDLTTAKLIEAIRCAMGVES